MKANIIDLSGNQVGQIDLPAIFEEEYRPDLIKRAVLSAQANRLQPYGPHFYAGMNTSARSWGPGHGVSRVPRIINARRAAGVPMAKGGRRSHAPQPNADKTEKINIKERKKAIRSAIAATTVPELVSARGHVFQRELPLIVQNDFESLSKTSDVKKFLVAAGLWERCGAGQKRQDHTSWQGKGPGQEVQEPQEPAHSSGQGPRSGKGGQEPSGR